eukprot:14015637-Alexandrium_andersonii.AAC.1
MEPNASLLTISTRRGASSARSSPRRGCRARPRMTATRRGPFEGLQEPQHWFATDRAGASSECMISLATVAQKACNVCDPHH